MELSALVLAGLGTPVLHQMSWNPWCAALHNYMCRAALYHRWLQEKKQVLGPLALRLR
jgi:hypothetical protein